MADLTIRGLPDELHRYLKQSAEAHHRSVNRETIALIERAMAGSLDSKPRLSAADLLDYDADGLPR